MENKDKKEFYLKENFCKFLRIYFSLFFLFRAAISRSFKNLWGGNTRTARSYHHQRLADPETTRQALLHNYQLSRGEVTISNTRNGKIFFLSNI